MARVVRRPAAQRDLLLQWVWYSENASEEVADRFAAAAEQVLALLSLQPRIGKIAFFGKSKFKELRCFPVSGGFDKFVLFYIPLEDGIELVRVTHGRRNLRRLNADGFFG
jgi:toxin ParE1/3/4